MPDSGPAAEPSQVALEAVRPPIPSGVVRRVGQALLRVRLFGGAAPRIGRFEVVRKLGEGGMGAVFEAVDPLLQRTVALKVLSDPARHAGQVDLEHEARMLARLSHPNVVAVHELGVEDGERYVCMAYVDGPNLATWLAERPGATWRTVVQQLLGAARGLAAAHRAGVVHRDFKLENVLVGSDEVPRVTDFGLARLGDGVGDAGPAGVAGTPGYLSPEVLQGQPADARSDQYAFFVALRRALRRVTGPVPEALGAHVARGLSEDPAARFPDLAAVEAALLAALERRGNADQRARDVLAERVRRLWIEPVRARLSDAVAGELPVPVEDAPRLVGTSHPIGLGDGSADAVAEALDRLRAGVLLVGGAGAGKTVRLLAIADALLRRERERDGGTLPVVLSLTSFAAFRGSFPDWVLHELVAKYALPRSQAERWFDDGQLALLLDGLDEVPVGARPRCVEGLRQLRSERPMAWVVTSREENDLALARRLDADAALRLRPLTVASVAAGLRAAGASSALVDAATRDDALVEQLANPLLLALFVQLADELGGGPLDAGSLRERLYALALRHGLDRDPVRVGPERELALRRLTWLAQATERVGASEIWLEELQADWLPGRGARAVAIGLGTGAAFALSCTVNLAAARVAGQPASSGWFFGVIAAAAAFVIQGGVRIQPMEAMRWSWPRVRTWIPRNLALGVVTGGLHGLFFDLWADLILGIATGLLGLSVIGLVPAGRERRVDPGDGLVESLRNSVLVAPLVGLVIGVPVGYVALPLARPLAAPDSMYHTHANPELAWAVTMGTSAAVTSLFITGFLAPLLHAALRVVLAATTPLPLRLAPWLDDLADRGLLHRVGGGWAFRHATFRAWLASRAGASG